MWTLHIIEIHVFPGAFLEFFYGMIVPTIQFLVFERGEKGFHDRIVTRFARRRKGLLHMKCFEQFLKGKGSVLCASVAMENQTFRWSAFFISCSKGGCDKLTAVLLRNLVGNYFAGIEIEDGPDIVHLFVIGKVGDVADPYLIGNGSGKLFSQSIGFLLCMETHIEAFGSCPNAGEIHLLHQFSNHFVTDSHPAGFQNGTDFFRAIDLVALIINLTDLFA